MNTQFLDSQIPPPPQIWFPRQKYSSEIRYLKSSVSACQTQNAAGRENKVERETRTSFRALSTEKEGSAQFKARRKKG